MFEIENQFHLYNLLIQFIFIVTFMNILATLITSIKTTTTPKQQVKIDLIITHTHGTNKSVKVSQR